MQIILAIAGLANSYLFSHQFIKIAILPLGLFLFALILKYSSKAILKKEALGFGDVKLFAVAGIILTIDNVNIFLFLSGFIGLFFGLIWYIIHNTNKFPFGPSLSTALYICLLISNLN